MLAQNSQLRQDAAAGEISASELRTVLAQLRAEPTDDEECAAKFKVFEGYSKLVEDLRKETYGFWDECKGDFDGPAARATEAELKAFDSQENMGPLVLRTLQNIESAACHSCEAWVFIVAQPCSANR